MIRGGNTYYYHYDGLGNVIALTNSNGNVVEYYYYDVFGKVSITDAYGNSLSSSSVDNPYFFTGRRLDTETGLYYYRNRYYNPETGRFLTPDPVGYSQGLNLYTYCYNNSVRYVDPMGLGADGGGDGDKQSWWEELQEGWETPPFWPKGFPLKPAWRFNIEENSEGGLDIEMQKGIELGIGGKCNINIPYTPHFPLMSGDR